MYEPYTYVTPLLLHEVEVTISGTITVTDLFLSMHAFICKTNPLASIYVEQTFIFKAICNVY